MQKKKVAIGLGSNLGDRLGHLREAASILKDEFLQHARSSSVYETDPWGITDQPKFANAVIVGLSEWKAPAILNYLKTLEIKLGRTATVKNGPREIDLDLLAFAQENIVGEGISVPHPGIPQRDFVLIPFVEVWPDWKHPSLHLTVGELTSRFLRSEESSAVILAAPLF